MNSSKKFTIKNFKDIHIDTKKAMRYSGLV